MNGVHRFNVGGSRRVGAHEVRGSVMEPSKSACSADAFAFGPFRLIPSRQLLLRNGVPVQLGSRALDILTALVRHGGELVSKNDLTAAVWPNTFVDDSNLKVNVCHLRRSLGDTQKSPQYIATVVGRGYRFVAPIQICIVDLVDDPMSARSFTSHRPGPHGDIIGHEWDLAGILAALRGEVGCTSRSPSSGVASDTSIAIVAVLVLHVPAVANE